MNQPMHDEAANVKLDAQFSIEHYPSGEPKRLDIRYRLDNASAFAIAVLKTAVAANDRPPGPGFSMTAEGDLTLALKVDPPRYPVESVPSSIYAVRLETGGHYEQNLSVELLSAYPDENDASVLVPPARVRLCQAYAAHSSDSFTQLTDHPDVLLARPGVHSVQRILCSPWITLRTP